MKALGLVVSDKKIFEYCIWKTYFFYPMTNLCNQSELFEQFWWGTTQGPFLSSLVKFPLAVQENIFNYIIQCKIVTPVAGSILIPGAYFEQLW